MDWLWFCWLLLGISLFIWGWELRWFTMPVSTDDVKQWIPGGSSSVNLYSILLYTDIESATALENVRNQPFRSTTQLPTYLTARLNRDNWIRPEYMSLIDGNESEYTYRDTVYNNVLRKDGVVNDVTEQYTDTNGDIQERTRYNWYEFRSSPAFLLRDNTDPPLPTLYHWYTPAYNLTHASWAYRPNRSFDCWNTPTTARDSRHFHFYLTNDPDITNASGVPQKASQMGTDYKVSWVMDMRGYWINASKVRYDQVLNANQSSSGVFQTELETFEAKCDLNAGLTCTQTNTNTIRYNPQPRLGGPFPGGGDKWTVTTVTANSNNVTWINLTDINCDNYINARSFDTLTGCIIAQTADVQVSLKLQMIDLPEYNLNFNTTVPVNSSDGVFRFTHVSGDQFQSIGLYEVIALELSSTGPFIYNGTSQQNTPRLLFSGTQDLLRAQTFKSYIE